MKQIKQDSILYRNFKEGKSSISGFFDDYSLTIQEDLKKNPVYYSNWAQLLLFFLDSPSEVVIMGPDAGNMRKDLDAYYLPSIILAGSDKPENLPLLKNRFVKSKNLIYVCKGNVCDIPVNTVQDAIIQIRHHDF